MSAVIRNLKLLYRAKGSIGKYRVMKYLDSVGQKLNLDYHVGVTSPEVILGVVALDSEETKSLGWGVSDECAEAYYSLPFLREMKKDARIHKALGWTGYQREIEVLEEGVKRDSEVLKKCYEGNLGKIIGIIMDLNNTTDVNILKTTLEVFIETDVIWASVSVDSKKDSDKMLAMVNEFEQKVGNVRRMAKG
jgi:hypothetical protein